MSRIAKWKLEKTKVKVVFRLQFHATHVPQSGWDKLFISFVPADSGKVTAKTTKANVRNGTCKWADPIYETTRLLQDTKTKKYDEKFYKLVVGMGSSRSSILGEANINLSDFADALKPSTASLYLQGCNFGTILHVTVQLLTSKTGFREFEQQRELRERGLHTANSHNGGNVSSSEEAFNDQVNARVKFKPESKNVTSPAEIGFNDEYADSTVCCDGSSNTSESLHIEKQEPFSAHEIDSVKGAVSIELGGKFPGQSPQPENSLVQVSNDWSHGWSSDYSAENDLAVLHEENNRLRGNLEGAESSILELQVEVSGLRSQAEQIGYETQTLSKQLAAEITSGEGLVKEVAELKSECSKLKEDLRWQKVSDMAPTCTVRGTVEAYPNCLIQDLQFRWLKGLLVVEDKITELQSRTCFGFHENDLRMLNSDFEALLSILQDLKCGLGEVVSRLSLSQSGSTSIDEIGESISKSGSLRTKNGLAADLCRQGSVLQCIATPDGMSHESDSLDPTTKEKNFELLGELDALKAERGTLMQKMDQMECYYEALIQELEGNQRAIVGELQNLRSEHSTCAYTISSTKADVEMMHNDMNEQILRFTEDQRHLESLNKELERRALKAEASLRRARLNYSIAIGQLQKDLEQLSYQVLSMHETNENLIRQAFPDFSETCPQDSPENSLKQRADFPECDASKQMQIQNPNIAAKKRQLGGDHLLDDLKKSLYLQEELYCKVEGEVYAMLQMNLYFDVFSQALQETLIDATIDVRLMKDSMDDLQQQLMLSEESKNLLKVKLQSARDDNLSLNEYNATCIAECKEMDMKNQNLESDLHKITFENHLLSQKVSEMNSLMTDYREYKSKYEACMADQRELSNSLTSEAVENSNLRQKISTMEEELTTCKSEFNELASLKGNLQSTVNSLQDKLHSILQSSDIEFSKMSVLTRSIFQNLANSDLPGVLLGLKELQQASCDKILQLMKDKEILVNERDTAQASLCNVEGEIIAMKQRYEHNLRDVVHKLDSSNTLVQKLQSKLEGVAQSFDGGLEAEEKYAQQQKEFLADLGRLEFELQQLTSTSEEISQEIIALETVNEELGETRSALAVLKEENQYMIKSLEDKTEASSRLTFELSDLKQNQQCLHDELCVERNLKDSLESTVTDLTLQLNDKCCKLLHFEQLKSEVLHLKELLSDLEVEKSRSYGRLSHYEEYIKSASMEQSSSSDLEVQLTEMQELAIAKDVEFVFTKDQHEAFIEELVKELSFSNRNLAELHQKHKDAETKFDHCLAKEKSQIEERARLLTSFDSLKYELDDNINQNRLLIDKNSILSAELETFRNKSALEIGRLKELVVCAEHDVNGLMHLNGELEVQNLVLKSKVDDCLVREKRHIEEDGKLLMSLNSLQSELDAAITQNRLLIDKNKVLLVELEKYKNRTEALECNYLKDRSDCALEIQRLKHMLACFEDDFNGLASLKVELEVQFLVQKTKLEELCEQKYYLEGHSEELLRLRNHCNELTHKLSEQTLKTEEFKNLASHLKDLKDRSDADCQQARKERVAQGPPAANQESLRIAFIKEQYETRLQDLKHQLSMSRKHNEEMLLKLQDAIDEVENRKKCEASHLKKNEELGSRIFELEANLQSLIVDKREAVKEYDKMKAELECTLLSLECCREEKEKLEALLQECSEEKAKVSVELDMTRTLLENSKSSVRHQKEGSNPSKEEACLNHDRITKEDIQKNPVVSTASDGNVNRDISPVNNQEKGLEPSILGQESLLFCGDAEYKISATIDDKTYSNVSLNVQPEQNIPSQPRTEDSEFERLNGENLLPNKSKHLALVNDHTKAESLWSSMDQLSKELERMRNDNSFLEDSYSDINFPGLERELMQLQKVNEELRTIYPMFSESANSGNALERVLALEIELAEALKSKKKSIINFQSSFLKQHSDEEAIFQSFRDINDLIGDLLEMKGRYRNVETELKDMHERYSQLSLQFAEVEGERQKLMMTLRNIRASRKSSNLNRSSSASPGEHC